jgi:nucleoside-diphosphate-sugar epimerase
MDENGNTIIKTKPRTGARRVLVTGGAGFVGSHLCDALVAVRDYSFFFLLRASPSSIERYDENNKFPRRALTTFFHFFRALKQRGDYVICMGTRLVHRFGSIVAPSV